MKKQNQRPSNIDKGLVLSGLIWKYLDRTLVQAVQFLVTILLARILAPDEFGLLTLVSVFLNIALVFVQHGIGSALIQKETITEGEFTSVFLFSLLAGGVMSAVIVVLAPFLCGVLGYPSAVPIVRVLAMVLPFAGISNSLESKFSRNLEFRKIFAANLSGALLSAVISIWAAWNGFGIWALVIQQLVFQLVSSLVLWHLAGWRLAKAVPFRTIYPLISYGWKILASSLIDTVYANLRTLLIGKYYSSAAVGYYDKGRQFPALIIANINVTIQSVLFPALSREQTDRKVVKDIVKRTISVSTYVIFPCMTGLMVVGRPLIRLLLTDKWLPALPYMQCFCMIYSLWPVSTTNLQAIKALGRSDIFLKLEIVKKAIGIAIMLFTLPMGIRAMMIGGCINAAIALFLNAFPNIALLDYHLRELFSDMLPAFVLSAAMGTGMFFGGRLIHQDLVQIVVEVLLGVALYIVLSMLFRVNSLQYVRGLAREYIQRKKQ